MLHPHSVQRQSHIHHSRPYASHVMTSYSLLSVTWIRPTLLPQGCISSALIPHHSTCSLKVSPPTRNNLHRQRLHILSPPRILGQFMLIHNLSFSLVLQRGPLHQFIHLKDTHNYYHTGPERSYRGAKPTIPDFVHRHPGKFAQIKIALENLLPSDSSELFEYQILLDHLKLAEACLIADSYLNSPTPYTDTMLALNDKYGHHYLLALKKIAHMMDSPDIRQGDTLAFERFALQIRALVGILQTLCSEGDTELRCGSYVARLLGNYLLSCVLPSADTCSTSRETSTLSRLFPVAAV